MLEWWNDLSLKALDPLLSWVLRLPSDGALVLVALLTAIILTVVRRMGTNQDRLRRALRDDARLKELMRDARARKDTEALQRFRGTRSWISMLKLKAEGLPLLLSLVPIALLATWAMSRLEFHPLHADQPFEVILYTSPSAEGEVVHLVPLEGLQSESGWVQEVKVITEQGTSYGEARWTLKGMARPEPYRLTVRMKGRTLEHEVLVGGPFYAPAVIDHGSPVLTEVKLDPVKLAGVVPGIPMVLPAWLVGYIVLSIPLVFVVRKVLHTV